MKIVYLHQYFVIPTEAGGNRSYYLASKLASLGVEVVVITSNRQFADWPFIKTVEENGFKVVYIKNRFDSKMGKLKRIFAYARFMFLATVVALKQKNTDLVYASSTPLTIGIPALAIKFRSTSAFVFELRDLWPDVPYELGYIRSKIIFKLTRKFEHYLYQKSDMIVTISDGIKNRLPSEYRSKTVTFPFGSELNSFSTNIDKQWRTERSIDQTTLVVYTGAIGWANGFDLLLDAAGDLCKINKSIHIALIGAGSALDYVSQRVEKENLSNISIFPEVPASALNRIYASADAGLILFSTDSETYYCTASPNKFFDYIAAGLPIVYHFGGPLSDQIDQLGIGIKVERNNKDSMVQSLLDIHHENGLANHSRESVREMAEKRWNKQHILTDLAHRLMQMHVKKGA